MIPERVLWKAFLMGIRFSDSVKMNVECKLVSNQNFYWGAGWKDRVEDGVEGYGERCVELIKESLRKLLQEGVCKARSCS